MSLPELLVDFAFGKVKSAMSDAFKKGLLDQLRAVLKAWASELPNDLDLEPEALFPKLTEADREANRPALAQLRVDFARPSVPTKETWLAALMEQWEAVQQDLDDPQKFFTLNADEARAHLNNLAGKLAARCAQDEEFFRSTVIDKLYAPPPGARSLESYWTALRSIAIHRLSPTVFTASRESETDTVRKWLSGSPASLFLQTTGLADGLDFLAALTTVDDHSALRHALIVYTLVAWRELQSRSDRFVLIATPNLELQATDVSAAVESGHYVCLTGPRANSASGATETLRRQDHYSIKEALVDSGYSESEAMKFAKACCGSTSVLKRLITRHPESAFPQWARDDTSSDLAPFALVGGWVNVDPTPSQRDRKLPRIGSDPPIDVEVVSELVDLDQNELEKTVQRWQGGSEPLFIRFGNTVLVASREDTWHLIGGVVSSEQLKRFLDLAILVLEEDNPAFQLAQDQSWMAGIYGKTHSLSQDLRRSLVETLGLLATYPRAKPKAVSDDMLKQTVRSVLDQTLPNEAPWQRWASFGNDLTIVAEADPEFFLSRVESDLATDNPELPKLFQDKTHSILGGAIHSDLLWALEGLAWNPEYLRRVCVCLAKLAARDPGGTYSNRPANSLREILLYWLWHTNASLQERIDAISAALEAEPIIGWQLLKDLLPSGSSQFSHNTHMPRWRTWADGWSRENLRPQIEEYLFALAELTIERAGLAVQRWSEVVEDLLRVHPDIQAKVFDSLERVCEAGKASDSNTNFALWDTLRKLVTRHERFSDAAWAFEESVRHRLFEFRDRLAPDDPVLKYRWLFDSQIELPDVDMVKDLKAYEKALSERRLSALQEIVSANGANGVVRLLDMGADGIFIGWGVGANGLLDLDTARVPAYLISSDHQKLAFARGFVQSQYRLHGSEFLKDLPLKNWSSDQPANLATCLPFRQEVWEWVETLSFDTKQAYWRKVSPIWRLESVDEVELAVINLKSVGRGFGAIDVTYSGLHDKLQLPGDLIAEVLEFALSDENSETPGDFGYHVEQLVKELQLDEGFDRNRLARIEWGFLPILDPQFSKVGPTTLIAAVESEPEFYVSLLQSMFRGENDQPDDNPLTEQEQFRARNSRKLLDGLSRLPGTQNDGRVDVDYLRQWLLSVQSLASNCDRRKVCDLTLGEFIARATQEPEKDWPAPEVAKLIEEIGSDDFFRGSVTGILNSRGATSRLPTAGGGPERGLADRYERLAEIVRPSSTRLAEAFLQVSRHYEAQAHWEDEEAHRARIGR